MKFGHLGDCHLGSWKQPELSALNIQSFHYALDKCIKEKVDFVLISGDLFDTAYPPIETLKDAFDEFRRMKEAGIPVFLIAGSHDYSASGKTFLDVLEKAGFCKNVSVFEERKGVIILHPTVYKNVAIYGYPGKKSGLEVSEIERIKLDDAPGFFKILLLHTALRDAVGTLPIDAVDHTKLPPVDYIALSHLHINYCKEGRAYSGPIFPNNISELDELKGGSFYIVDNGKAHRQEIVLKKVISLSISISNAVTATEEILALLQGQDVSEKIIILDVSGVLQTGKLSDIDFGKIESHLIQRGAYVFLKSTSKLHLAEGDFRLDSLDPAQLEQNILSRFLESNPSKFNDLVPQLLHALQLERAEEEKSQVFEERLFAENKKVLQL